MFTTEQSRWRAVTTRDRSANGHFVYSVKSTGIYCRPTCPARLARRANVGFYKTASEASSAGFRPCKRCKPEAATMDDPQARAVLKACSLIDEALKGAANPRSVKLVDLAKSVGFTPRYFHRIFKERMGVTPKEYATATEQMLNASLGSEIMTATADMGDVGGFDFAALDLDWIDFSGGAEIEAFMSIDTAAAASLENTQSDITGPRVLEGMHHYEDGNLPSLSWDITPPSEPFPLTPFGPTWEGEQIWCELPAARMGEGAISVQGAFKPQEWDGSGLLHADEAAVQNM